MPRRRTTNHLKLVHGTAQRCRMHPQELQLEPLTGEITPPDWLNVHGLREFRRIVPILQKKRVLTDADLPALGMLCLLYGKIVQAAAAGASVLASDFAQLRLLQSEFGLTPASRTRIAEPSGDDAEKNPFAQNRRGKAPEV